MRNGFNQLKALMWPNYTQVGTVMAYADGLATVELPGGGLLHARGEATAGQRVFVRDGAIEGPAPALEYVAAEVYRLKKARMVRAGVVDGLRRRLWGQHLHCQAFAGGGAW